MNDELKNSFTAYWQYLAAKTACNEDIFDCILDGYDTVELIAEKRNLDRSVLQILIVSLLHSGLLFINSDKLFLTEKGELLTENHPNSWKYACIVWADEHLTAWQNLEYTLKTGKSAFENIYKKKYFDFVEQNPKKLLIYHKAMNEYAREDYKGICEMHDFSQHETIVDIGGGLGALLKNISVKYPNIKCVLFEKPEVCAMVCEIEKIAGNFFDGIPIRADAFILSRILHDWTDDLACKIIQNVSFSLKNNGVLYIIENLPEKIQDNASLLSLNMKLMTNSYERKYVDYEILLNKSSFEIVEVKQVNTLQYMLICKRIKL